MARLRDAEHRRSTQTSPPLQWTRFDNLGYRWRSLSMRLQAITRSKQWLETISPARSGLRPLLLKLNRTNNLRASPGPRRDIISLGFWIILRPDTHRTVSAIVTQNGGVTASTEM